MRYSDEKWTEWMDLLATHGYVIVDNFISDELHHQIMIFFAEKENDDRLEKAGIGSSGEFKIDKSVRGDFVYWIDREKDKPLAPFFALVEELIAKLNQYCFLTLSGSEFHLAKYPAGSFYKKHLDQFHGHSNRQITILLYLNANWKPGDGGELKMYTDDGEVLVQPIAKRLLFFRSDTIEHEVLTTNVPRYSLTGWLLSKPADVVFLLNN
jgi:SM-20-related protein